VTRDDLRSFIGEGVHTAFRKASDSPAAVEIWHLINKMPGDEWASIVAFIADGVIICGVAVDEEETADKP
jgi:hypothetical protein